MKTIRILLIGASGVFGSRLAEGLVAASGIDVTLAGRDRAKLERVAAALKAPTAIKPLNRDTITPGDLAGYDLVIDAAGPFQASHSHVIDAAIAARCHYIDLADGREFLARISCYDAAAREAGIAVIAGASSIPALSHAVIDALTVGWRHIDRIKIGIYPGNRAPRGLAVVQAILSYTGKPVRVFRNGAWQNVPGWGMTHRVVIPAANTRWATKRWANKRWASVCDTPEQDLLVARYHPRQSAEFFAGLELSVLHLGLSALAMLVRWRLLASLRPLAAPLLWMAKLMLPFGSDKGAMDVQVWGEDTRGQHTHARWTLDADTNRGPYVPTLAALILARTLRDNGTLPIGAAPCSGIIELEEFADDFRHLGIVTTTSSDR